MPLKLCTRNFGNAKKRVRLLEKRQKLIQTAVKNNTINSSRWEKTKYNSIIDHQTKLEWFIAPDHHMDWYEANRWSKSLSVHGTNWRLPYRYELEGIYTNRMLSPIFKTTGECVWSSEHDSTAAWCLHLVGREIIPLFLDIDESGSGGARAFAVRSIP